MGWSSIRADLDTKSLYSADRMRGLPFRCVLLLRSFPSFLFSILLQVAPNYSSSLMTPHPQPSAVQEASSCSAAQVVLIESCGPLTH